MDYATMTREDLERAKADAQGAIEALKNSGLEGTDLRIAAREYRVIVENVSRHLRQSS